MFWSGVKNVPISREQLHLSNLLAYVLLPSLSLWISNKPSSMRSRRACNFCMSLYENHIAIQQQRCSCRNRNRYGLCDIHQ